MPWKSLALGVAVLVSTIASPAFAGPELDAAVATLSKLEGDKAKLPGYCKLVAQMATVQNETPESDALDEQFDALLRSYGPEFEKVATLSNELEEHSPDDQTLNAAFDKVAKQCTP